MRIENEDEASRLFTQAFALEEAGDLQQALSIRERLIEYSSQDERYILSMGRSFATLDRMGEAEDWYRKSIFLYPYSEMSSLQLFHFLWNLDRTDDAFIELRRFQSISHSDDYAEIVGEINEGDTLK